MPTKRTWRAGTSGGRVSGADVALSGLNGGPVFKHTEAFSFQVATEDQAENQANDQSCFHFALNHSCVY